MLTRKHNNRDSCRKYFRPELALHSLETLASMACAAGQHHYLTHAHTASIQDKAPGHQT